MPACVLFEDHTAARFRPLAASTPVCDLRCGMFSLRERVHLLVEGPVRTRLRPELRPLAGAEPATPAGEARVLWLAGRLPADFGRLEALLRAATVAEFRWEDENGLLAAAVSPFAQDALAASWEAWCGSDRALAWRPPLPDGWSQVAEGPGGRVHAPRPHADLERIPGAVALNWIWDVVPATRAALEADVAWLGERPWAHLPWGLVAENPTPGWSEPRRLRRGADDLPPGVHVVEPGGLRRGPQVALAPGVVVDASEGPVVLDRDVRVEPGAFLQGPLYLAEGCRVKAGARLYGESSFGLGNRLAGEIGETTCGDFVNKQHDGFLGHAVLGSWINLGAMTTCSDLKNNYGPVRVDLGDGLRDTGLRFVGLLAGDHVKTAIGTLFNTGTVVGFASNVFGGGMPPKHVPAFRWGGTSGCPEHDVTRALATATTVMARRGCRCTEAHEALFRSIAAATA